MNSHRLQNIIKKVLKEEKQLLNEQCTCYTENPVSGGAMLVYDLCGQGTQAASCSCCCSAWLHPTYVDEQACLTTSVAPPGSPSGGNGLGLYADEFLTVDDLDTGDGGIGLDIERDIQRGDLIKKPTRRGKSSFNEAYTPPGAFNVTGTYTGVGNAYNFKSAGPNPGKENGPGYDFVSKGPLGVNYFMEEDEEGPNPWAICTSSLGLEGKKRKDYTDSQKNKYEKCVLGMKDKIKESKIKSIINRVLKEDSSLYTQDTEFRDELTGQSVASTEMLDRMDAKLDTLTVMVNDLYDNLSRDWT